MSTSGVADAGFDGTDTYEVTVPAGIVHDDGYFSVTVYGTDDQMLIPNHQPAAHPPRQQRPHRRPWRSSAQAARPWARGASTRQLFDKSSAQ